MSGLSCVYAIRNESTGTVKIGHTNNLAERMRKLQTANPERLRLHGTIQIDSEQERKQTEKRCHRELTSLELFKDREWFLFGPTFRKWWSIECMKPRRRGSQRGLWGDV